MKKHLMPLFCAFAALALASCTKEADMNGQAGNKPAEAEGEGFGYLALSLNTDMVSRAEGDVLIGDETFNPGSENEYKLSNTQNTHIAIFFDESGAYFGNSYLSARGEGGDHTDGQGHPGDAGDNKYDSTEKLYTYITKDPRINKDGVMPAYVVVLLNVAPYRTEAILDKLNEGSTIEYLQQLIIEKTRNENTLLSQAFYTDPTGEEFFTMTNSVYTNDDDKLQVATKIEDRVYESMEMALQHPVTIFVERVVAKHSIAFYPNYTDADRGNATDISKETGAFFMEPYVSEESGIGKTVTYVDSYYGGVIAGKTVNWKAHIVGWGTNALEENTFLYKNLTQPNTYTEAGIPFTGDWWKAYGLHRSYWAVDPHYNNGVDFVAGTVHKYPTQYRPMYSLDQKDGFDSWTSDKIFKDSGDAYTEDTSTDKNAKNEWSLIYRSYNDISNRNAQEYTFENTFAYTDGLKGFAPLRYGTHVIVTSQLVFDTVDDSYSYQTNGTLSGITTKVNADGYFWSVDAYINYAYMSVCQYVANGTGHSFKNIFGGEEVVVNPANPDYGYALYIKDGQNYKKIVYTEEVGANEIAATEVFRLDETYLENGDGKRALKENQTVYVNVYTKYTDALGSTDDAERFKEFNDEPAWRAITEKEFASIVNTLLPLGAKYYNEGYMYYAIPIKHNVANAPKELVKYVEGDDTNAAKGVYEEGDFGVVRNHWYRMNVLTISKPGTPVEDPNDPIIPNDPEENDYMGVEIVILPWHVIEQDVYL